MSDVLTVPEVAERLQCSARTVYYLLDDGKLRYFRVGRGKKGGVRVTAEALEEFINGGAS